MKVDQRCRVRESECVENFLCEGLDRWSGWEEGLGSRHRLMTSSSQDTLTAWGPKFLLPLTSRPKRNAPPVGGPHTGKAALSRVSGYQSLWECFVFLEQIHSFINQPPLSPSFLPKNLFLFFRNILDVNNSFPSEFPIPPQCLPFSKTSKYAHFPKRCQKN